MVNPSDVAIVILAVIGAATIYLAAMHYRTTGENPVQAVKNLLHH